METSISSSNSFFHDIRSRELSGFRVRKRPYFDGEPAECTEIAALAVEHDGEETPPLAVSFCKTSKNSHILAVTDEDGYVSLFDTRRSFPSSASNREISAKVKISDWVAHHNAIFDVCWIKEDTTLLTASGDQTIKVWDAQEKKCTAVLMGHRGSVKSMYPHPANSDILISGSRDGSFALWDLRCNGARKSGGIEACVTSTAMVKEAHRSPHSKRVRRGKAASMSITSVLYLKDEVSVATAGAVDSIVKFWDTRNLKAQVTQACPFPKTSTHKESRLHGISNLSQDSSGTFLTTSCMDNRIYLYNVLQLEKGPVKSFSGCRIESFYVKSAISPDATHILSGSSDGNAYIWQVNKPDTDPITLKTHDGEVTAVDWCQSDVGKIATCSDDLTARVWNIQRSACSSVSSSSVRRRVMAPSQEYRKLLMNDAPDTPKKDAGSLLSSERNPIAMPTVSTPESQKKKVPSSSDLQETFERTPEAAMKSPNSVLNPPPSLKRKTIRDYFVAS